MPRRRDVLRVVGVTAAGGLATALAGCSGQSSSDASGGRLNRWAYDPGTQGEDWQAYNVRYHEPATLSRNRMYLTEEQQQRLFSTIQWAAFGDLDYVLTVGADSGTGSYPVSNAIEGSFGVGDVRRGLADGSTRVGTVAGRELYAARPGTFYAVDHGELVFVQNTDQGWVEAYLRDSDRSFVAESVALGRVIDAVGVGAATRVILTGDGVGGHSYHIDGPTTTVRATRPSSMPSARRRQFERRVSELGAELGYPDAATVAYERDSVFLELRMETREAPIGRDPFPLVEER
jgi:hypothetical protein